MWFCNNILFVIVITIDNDLDHWHYIYIKTIPEFLYETEGDKMLGTTVPLDQDIIY